jgi:hypothetical protein
MPSAKPATSGTSGAFANLPGSTFVSFVSDRVRRSPPRRVGPDVSSIRRAGDAVGVARSACGPRCDDPRQPRTRASQASMGADEWVGRAQLDRSFPPGFERMISPASQGN